MSDVVTLEKPRLKHLSFETTRHGKKVVYFKKGKGHRVRMPDDVESTLFHETYRSLLSGNYKFTSPVNSKNAKMFIPRIDSILGSAKSRAALRGIPFTITRDWVYERLLEQNCCCAITGLKFSKNRDSGRERSPYALSVDRIVPSLGYTQENCRLVLFAVNVMLMDWGLEAIIPIAAKVAAKYPAPKS